MSMKKLEEHGHLDVQRYSMLMGTQLLGPSRDGSQTTTYEIAFSEHMMRAVLECLATCLAAARPQPFIASSRDDR